jgi:hypothetical protein
MPKRARLRQETKITQRAQRWEENLRRLVAKLPEVILVTWAGQLSKFRLCVIRCVA